MTAAQFSNNTNALYNQQKLWSPIQKADPGKIELPSPQYSVHTLPWPVVQDTVPAQCYGSGVSMFAPAQYYDSYVPVFAPALISQPSMVPTPAPMPATWSSSWVYPQNVAFGGSMNPLVVNGNIQSEVYLPITMTGPPLQFQSSVYMPDPSNLNLQDGVESKCSEGFESFCDYKHPQEENVGSPSLAVFRNYNDQKEKKELVPEIIDELSRLRSELKNLKVDSSDASFRSQNCFQTRFKNKRQLLECINFCRALFNKSDNEGKFQIPKTGFASSDRTQKKSGTTNQVGIILQFVLENENQHAEFKRCFKQLSHNTYEEEGVLSLWAWDSEHEKPKWRKV